MSDELTSAHSSRISNALVTLALSVCIASPSIALSADYPVKPVRIVTASAGSGTGSHLTIALLVHLTGIDVVHVPYKGAGAALPAVVGGEVNFSSIAASVAVPQIQAGKVKAYAITSKNRIATLPDVPTGAQAGFPGFESEVWFGMLAPKGTSKVLVSRLNADIRSGLDTPEIRATVLARGAELALGTGAEFGSYIDSEIAKWTRVIKATGVRAE